VSALSTLPLLADDSAASVAVGGVVLTREPRISMESERLTISLSKVTVDYEFLNESDQDITTEVAFPIPLYEITESAGGVRDFNDFRLWVEYEVEAKAFLIKRDDQGEKVGGARDVTAILQMYKIDIPSLGHWVDSHDEISPDFKKLSPDAQKQLIARGLFDETGRPDEWEVRKKYHWKQTFPSHTILRVRHEYTPGFGFDPMQVGIFDKASLAKLLAEDKQLEAYPYSEEDSRLLSDTCVPLSLREKIFQYGSAVWKADPDSSGYLEASWVDFILTTANSWKTPIRKFELVIESTPTRDIAVNNWDYASFCWDGPITRVNAHRYEASATDFVPKRELKVLFLAMPVAEATPGESHHNALRRWIWVGLLLVIVVLAVIWRVHQSRRSH
jgi:hypothetical protein